MKTSEQTDYPMDEGITIAGHTFWYKCMGFRSVRRNSTFHRSLDG